MKPGDEDGEGKGIGAELSEEEKKALADEIKQAAIQAAQNAGMDATDPVKRMINELVVLKWIGEIFRTQLESPLKTILLLCVQVKGRRSYFSGMNKDEQLNIAIALDIVKYK